MEIEKTVGALNELVEINNDRIEGYKKASENVEERDLKDLFLKFENTSRKCLNELNSEVNQFGGKATEETNTSGKIFRAWMDFKSDVTGKDKKAILNSCEYGEVNADKAYERIIDEKSEYLSPQQQLMVKEQRNLLKSDHNQIKRLLNNLIEA